MKMDWDGLEWNGIDLVWLGWTEMDFKIDLNQVQVRVHQLRWIENDWEWIKMDWDGFESGTGGMPVSLERVQELTGKTITFLEADLR